MCCAALLNAADPNLETARALVRAQRWPEARAALEAQAASADAQYLLAYVLFREGKARDSLARYDAASRLAPPASDDLKVMGLDYGLLGDYTKSAGYLRQALEKDPNNLEARYYLGRVYYTENRFDDAIREFEAVLQRDPAHVKAQNHLGQALEGLGRGADAATAYEKAIDLDRVAATHTEYPYLNLAILHIEAGREADAIPLLETAKSINPKNAQVHFRLGSAYAKQNNLQSAERELTEAVRLDPKNAATRYVLGRTLQRLGKAEQAARELQTSQQLRNRR